MMARLLPLAARVALAACAEQGAVTAPRSTTRVYAVDMQGQARLCNVTSPTEPAAGAAVEAKMTLGNDGGWCAVPVNRPGPQPYAAGLLTARAQRGNVTIHTVGDVTRLDYRPDTGFSGEDRFTVRLVPGDTEVKVAVTVQPVAPVPAPAAAAAPPAARPATPAPAPTPARRRRS